MHFVNEISDEGLYGLLARHLHVNGYRDHLKGLRKLSGKRIYSLADLPVEEIMPVLPHLSIQDRSHLGTLLLEKHLGNEGVDAQNLATFSYGNLKNRFWKTCNICREEDEARYGVAIWHRKHQLLTTLKCPIHLCELHSHKISKKLMHDKLMLPFDTQGILMKQDAMFDKLLIELSRLGYEALCDSEAPFSSSVIKQTFVDEMYRRGYFTRGKVNSHYFIEFESSFGKSFLELMKAEWGISSAQDLLDGIINEVSDKTSYASRLILIHWWFCDWELFKSKCLWASTFGYTFTDLRTNGFESLKIQYRANCLQLIESGQIRDRAGLLKREYKMFRWLRANDSKWLDKYLPILNKNNQSALF